MKPWSASFRLSGFALYVGFAGLGFGRLVFRFSVSVRHSPTATLLYAVVPQPMCSGVLVLFWAILLALCSP